jgi:hypothetical protein
MNIKNSKLQKIPLTPFKKGGKQALTCHEEFSLVSAQAECNFSQTAESI